MAKNAQVEDIVYLVLLFAVDYHRRGRRLALAGERVGGGMFQQGHVENRVGLHCLGEADADGMRRAEAGVGNDLKGAEATVVQLW